MNNVTELIVGIDVGSAGLTGGLARKNTAGETELLALEHIPGNTGVRRGVVHNIEEVSRNVQTLLDKLTKQAGFDCKVNKVYAGINGYTIRTIDATSSIRMSGDEKLSESQLDELNDDAQSNLPEGLAVIDVFPQEYLLDGKKDANPVGTMPQLVEARYKIVAGQPFIFKNMDACFDSIDVEYEPVLGSVASAEAILKPEDRAKGVVVVDFGAQTTSVCVIKNNIVRYIAVLPFGGDNLTKDLQHLNIEADEAEAFKIKSGSAIHLADKPTDEETDSKPEKYSTFDKEANEILVARAEEIVENIYAQIRYSGIELQKLTEGIVMTGGASRLSDLSELLTQKTGLSVRTASPDQHLITIPEGLDIHPEDALCIGLLLLGKADCCVNAEKVAVSMPMEKIEKESLFDVEAVNKVSKVKPPKPEKAPKTPKGPRFGGLWKSIFDEDDM